MNPALNSDGTYDWGTKWSATLVAWKGFKAGRITSDTSGTCYSNMTVTASSASITDNLVSIKMYKHGASGFVNNEIRGQDQFDAAYKAAQKLLDGYPSNIANWVDSPNNMTYGTGQSAYWTRYQAMVIKTAIEHPSITLKVRFAQIVDYAAGIHCKFTDVSNYTKYARLIARGGDKGHYAESKLYVTVSVPGMADWNFVNTFWTNTD